MKKGVMFLIIIGVIAIIVGAFFLLFIKYPAQPSENQISTEKCLNSGGTVTTSLCCGDTNDFPNTCAIGACGCAPSDSHNIRVCDCGSNKCFNGTGCVFNS